MRQHWQFADVNVLPHPLQQPHPPIWLATASPAGITRAVSHDWGLMFPQGQTMTQVAEHMRNYRAALEAVGRPFDSSRVVLARGLHVAPNDAQAWDEVEAPYLAFQLGARRHAAPPELRDSVKTPFDTDSLRESAVFGDPDACAGMLERIRDLGIENVIFFVHLGGMPPKRIRESMQLFSQEVMPRLVATPETV
jgi:alkanesulfonate monooxygenase SsuD/methylene tetrahydromethanopterin reductase-like flavin-dependent oxidoreductase (luciferase family)